METIGRRWRRCSAISGSLETGCVSFPNNAGRVWENLPSVRSQFWFETEITFYPSAGRTLMTNFREFGAFPPGHSDRRNPCRC